jgi:hypothetical protein
MPSKRAYTQRPTENEELDMMSHPERWPQLVLPLKNYKLRPDRYGLPKVAILFASLSKPHKFSILYDANIFGKPDDRKPEPITDLQTLITAGWIVD